MNQRIVTDIDAIEIKEWERFVYEHPQGNIFQTPQMYMAYSATRNYRPIVVACYEAYVLVGILLAVVQKEYTGLLGKLSARSIIWGGPLVKDNDISILDKLMNDYDRKIRKQVIYTQIRNIFPVDWLKEYLDKNRYETEGHLNILIGLDKSVEMLWKQLYPTRRKQIDRGYRRGVEFCFVHNPDATVLSECYELVAYLYKRIKLPFPKKELFLNSYLNTNIGLFLLRYHTKIIGCRFVLLYKEYIYDWYAGSKNDFLDKYPNDILPWEVMKWGAENGYKVFDFGGAGKPGVPYGVRDFKLKFGGELVDFKRFQKTHNKFAMNIAKLGFRLWKLLKK